MSQSASVSQFPSQAAQLSMYQASVPVIVRNLTNLSEILKKGEAFAAAKKIDPSVLLNSRLAPDMFPFTRQIQIASDVTKGGVARLAGAEIPSYADSEASFAELQERIAKTIKFVSGFTAAQIDGTEGKQITLTVGGTEMKMNGQQYLLGFVLPNLFFHVTTAYAILRHNGVDVGKRDFLGSI